MKGPYRASSSSTLHCLSNALPKHSNCLCPWLKFSPYSATGAASPPSIPFTTLSISHCLRASAVSRLASSSRSTHCASSGSYVLTAHAEASLSAAHAPPTQLEKVREIPWARWW